MTTKATSTSDNAAGYDVLRELEGDFWTWRAANQPVSYDDIPRIERPAGWVSDWSPAAIERRRRELDAFSSAPSVD